MGRRPAPRWAGALLVLGVPLLMAALAEAPMGTDRPVETLALSPDYDRMLLFFGYVDCPDVCPTTMAALSEAHRRYRGEGQLGVTFVNLTDAEPGLARAYARGFHPAFEGLQASGEDRRALFHELGVRYRRSPDGPQGWHTDSIYLLKRTGRQWRLRTVARRRPIDPEWLSALVQEL